MTLKAPVAFYAPLKAPDHPHPSGDRTMARLLMQALSAAGFPPRLASDLRTLDLAGDAASQAAIRRRSEAVAAGLIDAFKALPEEERPRLWFTYHVYYKAPDWIGPLVADALRLPYVVAEGSRASKRAAGPWALSHLGAEAALDRADLVLAMTEADLEALERARPEGQAVVLLPPFLDEGWTEAGPPPLTSGRPPALLAVGMMRAGDKQESYRLLAESLTPLSDLPWTLTIIGDGPARADVEARFARFGGRVRFTGAIPAAAQMRAFYGEADLLVWPAVNEAYGMALLEAQACGLPVVAGAYGGVRSVVEPGVTGLLTPPGDMAAFSAAIRSLLADPMGRGRLGAQAHRRVRAERSLAAAAARLRAAIAPLLGTGGA